jgi:hypothetical protein
MGVIANMIGPIFVEFYEAYVQVVLDSHQKTFDRVPEVWRFARVIRNGISHGYRLRIDGTNERPVTWYGLTYSKSDNGRSLLGTIDGDLWAGDLVVLMFEMDDLLEKINCPI